MTLSMHSPSANEDSGQAGQWPPLQEQGVDPPASKHIHCEMLQWHGTVTREGEVAEGHDGLHPAVSGGVGLGRGGRGSCHLQLRLLRRQWQPVLYNLPTADNRHPQLTLSRKLSQIVLSILYLLLFISSTTTDHCIDNPVKLKHKAAHKISRGKLLQAASIFYLILGFMLNFIGYSNVEKR